MRKKVSDRKKSKIVNNYLLGLTRDKNAEESGVSTGSVSKGVGGFTKRVDEVGLEKAAEEYDVIDTVENLRELSVNIRKNGTSVGQLMGLSSLLERVEKYVPRDKVEEVVKVVEGLKNPSLIATAMRLLSLEERTGKTRDEILAEVERKDARLREQSEEIQRRNIVIEDLEEGIRNLEYQKARLIEEEKEFLKEHNLTMEGVNRASKVEGELKRCGIDLTRLEGLQPVLDTVEKAGHDPKKIIELIREYGTLQDQTEAQKRDLAEIQEKAVKLDEKLTEAEPLVKKLELLESMGWNTESLGKTIKLAREAGSSEEVLSRLELFKPSAEMKAELEEVRAEVTGIASKKKGLQKRFNSLKRKYKDLEFATNTLMSLLKVGFTEEVLTSIYNEALKYGSMPRFIETFSMYKHKKEVEAEVTKVSDALEELKREFAGLKGRHDQLLSLFIEDSSKYGALEEKMETMNIVAKTAESLVNLRAGEPDVLNITNAEQIICLVGAIRPWCEWAASKIEGKVVYVDREVKNVGVLCSMLIKCIHKIGRELEKVGTD